MACTKVPAGHGPVVTTESENESLGNENESLRLPAPECSTLREVQTTIEGCIGHTEMRNTSHSWFVIGLVVALSFSGFGRLEGAPLPEDKKTEAKHSDATADQQQMRGLDEQVQEVKSDVLSISAELNQLEEKLLYPSGTQVAIFIALAKGDQMRLD